MTEKEPPQEEEAALTMMIKEDTNTVPRSTPYTTADGPGPLNSRVR